MDLDKRIITNIIINCSTPAYTTNTREKVEKDIASIRHHLVSAKIFLAFLESIKFERLYRGQFGRGGVEINISSGDIKVSGTLKFMNSETYRVFTLGNFFGLLSEISIIADVTGTLLKLIYSQIHSSYRFPRRLFFHNALLVIKGSTRRSNLKNYINSNQAILDFNSFLPGTGTMNESLSSCNYSYQLIRRLRNVPEHNSFEELIFFKQSQDGLGHRARTDHYAEISPAADSVCGTLDCFARLSGGKDGSRDVLVFGKWVLEKHIELINDIFSNIVSDF